METPLEKLKRIHNPSFITEEMLQEEKEHFENAFQSGWLRCNALTYDKNFFDYYWDIKYKNNQNN